MKLKRYIEIPIYGARLWIVVAKDLHKARRKFEYLFGPITPTNYNALCSRDDGYGKFGLFFKPEALTRQTIAHEIFHLTHRILEWVGAPFEPSHHEYAALLNGYLTETVYKVLEPCLRQRAKI